MPVNCFARPLGVFEKRQRTAALQDAGARGGGAHLDTATALPSAMVGRVTPCAPPDNPRSPVNPHVPQRPRRAQSDAPCHGGGGGVQMRAGWCAMPFLAPHYLRSGL